MTKPLLFSEYRVAQALFIQQEQSKLTYLDHLNNDQFLILMYQYYLRITGLTDGIFIGVLEDISRFKIVPDMYGYDPEIKGNLNAYIDNLVNEYFKDEQ